LLDGEQLARQVHRALRTAGLPQDLPEATRSAAGAHGRRRPRDRPELKPRSARLHYRPVAHMEMLLQPPPKWHNRTESGTVRDRIERTPWKANRAGPPKTKASPDARRRSSQGRLRCSVLPNRKRHVSPRDSETTGAGSNSALSWCMPLLSRVSSRLTTAPTS